MLREQLLIEGREDPDDLARLFAEWKAEGKAGEYLYYYFGKNGFYDHPKRSGRRVLHHVHLPPDDPHARKKWARDAEACRRKTSDSSLIYTEDAGQGCLLLYIAREPTGHQIARMETAASRALMNSLADVADRFIHDGTIII